MRVRRLLIGGTVAAVATALLGAAPSTAAPAGADDGLTRVVVQVKQKKNQGAVSELIRGNRGKVTIKYDRFPLLAATVNDTALRALRNSPHVTAVQEDIPQPPALNNTLPWQNIDDVQTLGWTGAGWAVAILDTGIDRDHPFFGTRIASEACYSNAAGGGTGTTLCPDGTNAQTTAGAADAETANCLNGTANLCAHGAHVSGIAAGNAAGVTGAPGNGVAPGANIIAIQVFTRFADSGANTPCAMAGRPSPCVLTYTSDQILGLQRVLALDATMNIAAANMSLGDASSNATNCDGDTRKAAIDNLLSNGIVTVIAAGNNSNINGVGAPGCISTAVTVGSVNTADALAGTSDRGALLDLLATGVGVNSSVPDDTFGVMGGTSMAAPHVAGAFAILREAYPSATAATLLGYLTSTGVPITYSTGGTNTATTPRLDMLAALQAGNAPPTLAADNANVTVNEGATASNTGTFSDPESNPVTLSASVGSVSVSSPGKWSWSYGTNDGPAQSQMVTISGTDNKGETGSVTFALTVDNVAPTVTIDSGQVKSISEGDVLSVLAHFSDPGKDAPYSSLINWGTPAGDISPGSVVVTKVSLPQAGDVTGSHQYGDNGSYTITVYVNDKDGGTGSQSFNLTVNNVPPTATIDESGTVLVNGVPTLIVHAGETATFSGRSTDPGSDDLSLAWDWGDGAPAPDVTTLYLVNPPSADPLPSPSVQPRDVTDTQSHAFGDACFYTIGFTATDDDGGTASDAASVIVTGNATDRRSAGYWLNQYRERGGFTTTQLACYLAIVGHMSQVFDEVTDASTIEKAVGVLFVNQNSGSMEQLFDQQLLAAWLNFADGSVGLDTPVDIDRKKGADTTFGAAISAAEAVRLDPNHTRAELKAQKDILERINLG